MISISCIIIYVLLNSGQDNLPIEKIDISSGVSYDLVKYSTMNEYNVAASMYSFNKKEETSSTILEGIGMNIPDTRSTRQTIGSKEFMVGLQKVFIFSEAVATKGINPIADILFSNQDMNDSAWVVVCKGKALDMLKFKVEDATTSADHINGMIESSRQQNFMSNNYKITDMYVRVNSEGRNLVLPYLEIINNKIALTSMAVFKEDKMVANVPMDQARIMNFLRENKTKGILTLQKDSYHYISAYGAVKRKVHCEKVKSKYKFYIDLTYQGKVISNTMYPDFQGNSKTVEKFSHELEEETKKNCDEFIKKMQNEYKLDCLELGRDAAASFGRNKGTDWNAIVCKSEIIVNVKVKVDNLGRGQFLFENK